MKLVIIFFGLIIHVNQPWTLDNTAVIPDAEAEGHKAEMWIPRGAVVDWEHNWMRQYCGADPCVVPLKGINVRVTGTRGRYSSMSDKLISSLPPLKTLAPRCRLRDEVRSRTPVEGVLASFIDYRGGSRWVETSFEFKASFMNTLTPWKDPRCLTCKLRYEAELEADTATLIFTDTRVEPDATHPIQIRGGYTLQVIHLPPKDAPPGHFGLHYRIYEPSEDCRGPHPMVDDQLECKGPVCKDSDYPFPFPFPQADCTNTGHP